MYEDEDVSLWPTLRVEAVRTDRQIAARVIRQAYTCYNLTAVRLPAMRIPERAARPAGQFVRPEHLFE